MAIRYAAECGAPVVNTDEGLKAPWTTEAEDFVLMRYTLREASFLAERRGVAIGLECHAQYSKTPDGLDRIYHLVDSPAIGINLDTGNAYLAGQNPYTWLERRRGSSGALARQGHHHGTLRRGARQGGRNARRLRVRRGGHRLETRDRDLPPRPRHRHVGRMRHDRPGRASLKHLTSLL